MQITPDFVDSVLDGQEQARTGWNGAEGGGSAADDTNQPQAQASPFDAVADPATRDAFMWQHENTTKGLAGVNQQIHGVSDYLVQLRNWIEQIALSRITGEAEIGREGVGGALMALFIIGGAVLSWLGFWLLAGSFEHSIEAATERDFAVPWGIYLGVVMAGGLLGLALAAQLQKTVIRLRRWVADSSDQEVDRPTEQLAPPSSQVA